MTDLHRLGATEIARRVREGDARAEDVVRACLDRAAATEPGVHAFLHLDGDAALEKARAVDRRRRRGEDPGPLAGVPVAIKDNLAVAGRPLTCASRMLEGFVAPRDAAVVERLRAAGAVVLGKTDLDEFAMGSSGEHSALSSAGGAHNPRDLGRVPGGSSSGSAAAVAAGSAPVALGSDTGGSLRQPAAFCGVVGLKPTWGRVSRRGLVTFASSLDCVGPIARSVDDAALVLAAIEGRDPGDATSVASPEDDPASSLDGLRIGIVRRQLDGWQASAEVEERFAAAVETLRDLGAEVDGVDEIDALEVAAPCYRVLSAAEASANLARFDGVRYGLRVPGETVEELHRRSRGAGFGAEVKRRIILGTYALSAERRRDTWAQAERVRSALRRSFHRLLEGEGRHVLALPTTPTTAFPRGERSEPLAMYASDHYTIPASLAGLPALSLPCGRGGESGLPASLQLVGRPFAEPTLLRLGRAFEDAAGREDVSPVAPVSPGADGVADVP